MRMTSAGAATLTLTAMLGLGGCATEGFVRDQVAAVDRKVDERSAETGARLDRQGSQLADVDRTSREALDRARAAGKLAEGKFLYSLVLSDDSIKFPVDRASLSVEAQTRLQAFVDKLRRDNRNVYVEIQGHTDDRGSPASNKRLGEERAEAVRVFMNRNGVALNRMATISYGQEAPAAPNATRAGRAQNRRVVVVVLA